MGQNSFMPELFVLTLSGFDFVLEVNWLMLLGPILWNFDNMLMKFTWKGREVELKGL